MAMKRPAPKLPPPQKENLEDWLNDDEDEMVKVSSQRIASQRISSQIPQPLQSNQPQFIPPQPPPTSNSVQASVFKEPLPKIPRITGPQSNNIRSTSAQNFPRPIAQRPFQPVVRQTSFNSRPTGPSPFPRVGAFQNQRPPPIRFPQQNPAPRPQILRPHIPRPSTHLSVPPQHPKKIATASTGVQTICDYQNQKLGPMKYQMFKGQLDLMWQMRAELKKPSLTIQDAFPKFNTFYDLKDS
uniref:Uncharacterized protein n=1 Tax=Panagrolaimus davidi TaxID=227884 RepID=A0A914Q8K7_9BILA